MDPTLIQIATRFLITFILSLIFGLERQSSHKPIGFGTFIFVSVGSCGLAIAAISLNMDNPFPILAAIVTGIGFLGAGALIKTTDKIFGFTTAASIWIFAIFGLIIGIGYYLIGLSMYVLIWAVIFIDKLLEKKGIGSYRKKIIITTNKIINLRDVKDLIKVKKLKLIEVNMDNKNNKLVITCLVEGTKEEINDIPKKLLNKEWLDSCKIE